MSTVALIPARGGSKGILKKNIANLGGYPLIAYSIQAAKLARNIHRVIVSTDSPEIAAIAKKFGAEVPFMRPSEFAQDKSTDAAVFTHALDWFLVHEGVIPELCVHLRPTTPLRNPLEIEKAIDLFRGHPTATSLRSAHELAEPPHKMFQLGKGGYFEGFFPNDPRPEYYNLPRQELPKAYQPNGYVDIIRTDFFVRERMLHGPKILGFITPFAIEVDMQEDLERLTFQLSRESAIIHESLKDHFQ